MIPRILHFTTGSPTPAQHDTIATARRLHPDWQLRHVVDPLNANDYELSHLWPSCTSGAQFADLVRLEMVYRHGGFYLDSDVHLVRSLDPLVATDDLVIASEDGWELTQAVFGAPAGHPALRLLIDHLSGIDRLSPTIRPTVSTGPRFFSEMLRGRADITLLPRESFYPYNWDEPVSAATEFSFGVHAWAGSWTDAEPRPLVVRAKGWTSRKKRRLRQRFRRARELPVRRRAEFARQIAAELRSPTLLATADDVRIDTGHGHVWIPHNDEASISAALDTARCQSLGDFVTSWIGGSDHVIDVGPGYGEFTVALARRVGPWGRVLVVEDDESGRAGLERNFASNRVGHQTQLAGPHVGTSLDSCIPGWDVIRLLNINATPALPGVVAGAKRLVAEERIDLVRFSMSLDARQQAGELRQALHALHERGYEFFRLLQNGLAHVAPDAVEYQTGHDLLAMSRRIQQRSDIRARLSRRP